MEIRPYNDPDLEDLVALFTSSVHVLGAPLYGPEQLNAWAPHPPEIEFWRKRLLGVHLIVATDESKLAGFISYEENGHIDLLYTDPIFQRRGVATRLLLYVEQILEGIELFTEASLVAKPFFLKHNFCIVEEQTVSFRGVTFQRYAMRKAIVS
ncbi:MAG TPA: GNAT family N-acetyltransferase [Blastocatellia bacterium]|nr:GNAT family N-acetyltransferase [Blastocatellia bacterium]